MSGARVALAGIGNEMRHDDGVGPVVAARARRRAPASTRRSMAAPASPLGEPLDLLGYWDGVELAIVVDAVRSGAPGGTVTLTWLEAGGDSVPRAGGGRPSTHGLGLADVYCLAQALGQAPRRVAVVGIEGEDFSHGNGLSPAVAAGADQATTLVVQLARGAWAPPAH